MYQSNKKTICCLAGDLLADVVKAETNVGGVGVANSGVGVSGDSGVSGVGVSGDSGDEEGIGLSLPLLAAVKVGASEVSVSSVSGVSGGAWDGDVGSVDAGGRLEGGKSVGVAGVTSVEEARVGLGLSVDGGHEGAKNNLRNR